MWIAAVAGVVYAALGQRAFHGVDVHEFLQRLGRGDTEHRYHFLYLPIAHAFVRALPDLSVFEAARLASAACAAVGVGLHHAAARALGLARGAAGLLAALCAAAPAVVFFATVVEVHGVFFLFVGGAWWCVARAVARPSAARVAAVGLCSGLAGSVHATGHLLLPLAAAVWWGAGGHRRWSWSSTAACWAGAAVAHATEVLLLSALLQPAAGGDAPLQGQAAMLVDSLTLGGPAQYGAIVVHEWLLAYAPVSLWFLLGFAERSWRVLAAVVLGSVLFYLGVLSVLLIHFGTVERGAYTMPLLWPAALIVARLAVGWRGWAAVVLAAALAVALVVGHDRPGHPDRYAVDLMAAVAPERPVVVFGDVEEGRAVMRVDAGVAWVNAAEFAQAVRRTFAPAGEDAAYGALCGYFDGLLRTASASGNVYLFTDSALRALSDEAMGFVGRWAREHLAALDRTALQRGEFRGTAVRLRE